MKILSINNFWEHLKSSVGEKIPAPKKNHDAMAVSAARKDPYPQEETANILGEDSGVLFSNRFIYDTKTHDEIMTRIKDIKATIKSKFNTTALGRRLENLEEAANSLKQQVISGKIEKTKPKVEKRKQNLTDDDEESLLNEIEEQAVDVTKEKNTGKAPGKTTPSGGAKSADPKELVKELADQVKTLCAAAKKFATQTMVESTEKAIEQLESYRGDTLGETYRRVVVPKPPSQGGDPRTQIEDMYLSISNILNHEDLLKLIKNTDDYKTLHQVFLSSSEMSDMSQQETGLPNAGVDFLEVTMGSDEFSKQIFHFLAEQVRNKGAFTGKLGNFQITETESGDFSINGESISRNSLDEKYKEFVQILIRASVSDNVTKYFEAILEREDIGAELNKYICLKFVKFLSSDIKKSNLQTVYSAIDKEFAGTEFVNLFKNVVKNLEVFTPSIEHVENERVRVDNNASIQIYESHGEYFAVLYYGSLPPKRFAIDRIGEGGYANYVVKNLSTNRNVILQDLYKKIMEIQIRNEVLSNMISDPSQSKYKDSKYFNEIINGIEEETKRHAVSKLKYFNIIKKIAQFSGSEGHPAFGDDPLAKFTISVNYKGSVSLFVDITKTSDSTFRITGVQFSSGDRTTASRLINLLNNKTGNYDFNTAPYKDLSSATEAQRREINKKITSFYTKFLTSVVDNVGMQEVSTPSPKPEVLPQTSAPSEKILSKEELLLIYHEFNELSDKAKRTPAEEARLASLKKIVESNTEALREIVESSDSEDLEDFESKVESTHKSIKTMPKYEQNKMVRTLDSLYDRLETATSKDRAKIQEEIDRITNSLVDRGDFSDYRNVADDMEDIESKMLELSVGHVPQAQQSRAGAITLIEKSPLKEEYKENARKNLDKYPHLKSYLENIYSPEFVRLVYAD